jgi:hypothetical protein
MKPQWLDQKEYERCRKSGREACEKEKMPLIDAFIELGAAGQWLWDELKKLGLEDDKASSVCFAHGQACFPRREPWETARAILEQTKADNAPKGGEAYGDALLNGEAEGLPRGGMQIVKVGSLDEKFGETSTESFRVGQSVKATRQITEAGGVIIGDEAAKFPDPAYIHANRGDSGIVEHIDGDGEPTVRFDRTRTATVVALAEIIAA